MRKRTKRTVRILTNPIAYVIEGARVPDEQHLQPLRMRELMAIEAFAKGHATLANWHDLSAMLNVAEVFAISKVGPEALETCRAAEQALIEAAARYENIGRMGTTGPGLQAFRALFEYHDLQRQSVSLADYERMILKARQLIRSKAARVKVIKKKN